MDAIRLRQIEEAIEGFSSNKGEARGPIRADRRTEDAGRHRRNKRAASHARREARELVGNSAAFSQRR